jgi:hypothetical protein
MVKKFKKGDTFALRSIRFDESDTLVAVQVVRFDEDGSVIFAWRKLKDFPSSQCRQD